MPANKTFYLGPCVAALKRFIENIMKEEKCSLKQIHLAYLALPSFFYNLKYTYSVPMSAKCSSHQNNVWLLKESS